MGQTSTKLKQTLLHQYKVKTTWAEQVQFNQKCCNPKQLICARRITCDHGCGRGALVLADHGRAPQYEAHSLGWPIPRPVLRHALVGGVSSTATSTSVGGWRCQLYNSPRLAKQTTPYADSLDLDTGEEEQ